VFKPPDKSKSTKDAPAVPRVLQKPEPEKYTVIAVMERP